MCAANVTGKSALADFAGQCHTPGDRANTSARKSELAEIIAA
jgi:hypothetical protein